MANQTLVLETSIQALTAAANMTAAEFMKVHGDNYRVEILDADNILDYNDGYLNIEFHGSDEPASILFIDGQIAI